MKKCNKCGEIKPPGDFYIDNTKKDNKSSHCKECVKERTKKRYEKHREEIKKYHKKYYQEHIEERKEKDKDRYHNRGGRERQNKKSMYKNKTCSNYLGIVVAERLIKHLFNDVEMMPYGHPGYDMICNKGKKINVKASTIHIEQSKNLTTNFWQFRIGYNKECDFFLCMSFDNVEDINPLIAWMIPVNETNENSSIQISATTIHKWDKWKMDLNNAQTCCDLMKGTKL